MRVPGRLTLVAAAGGAVGAGGRAWLTELGAGPVDDQSSLWVTLAINVLGCAALAWLPAATFVRRSHGWSVFLGTGVLGGFTTMSTAVALPIAALSAPLALGYIGLTLVGAVLAVRIVRGLVPHARVGASPRWDDGP